MVLKLIVGIIQIVISLVFIGGAVASFFFVQPLVTEAIQAGSARVPLELQQRIDLSLIDRFVIVLNILIGLSGLLFLLLGLVNIKKDHNVQIQLDKKEQFNAKEEIPNEY
mgnify:CR=1 FL=1